MIVTIYESFICKLEAFAYMRAQGFIEEPVNELVIRRPVEELKCISDLPNQIVGEFYFQTMADK
jgi:hypothetical protein